MTDGACRGNPGPGGWAALIIHSGTTEEIGGHVARATNNRMELQAAVEALRRVAPAAPVRIVTDSRYLVDGATRWLRRWRSSGWTTLNGEPVEHRDLWEELEHLAGTRVIWEHVRGHVGHPENERANALAQAYADRRPAPARGTGTESGSWPLYLSLVNGRLVRHATWEECRARVYGVSGARYKKCANASEAIATLAGWGLGAEALEETKDD